MTILRNTFAIIVGLLLGASINMLIITYGSVLVPPPVGVDPSDMESIKAAMPSYGPEQFLVPFLAHAVGTLVGAFTAYLISVGNRRLYALTIGLFFLFGGVFVATQLPAPVWFICVDLLLAYIPMAWLGYLLGRRLRP